VFEINSDAEDHLLVEALQEYEDSKFGADTIRMDLKPPGPTSFITPSLQGYKDSKFGADTTRTSFITVPEPEQVKIIIGMQLQGLISSIYVMHDITLKISTSRFNQLHLCRDFQGGTRFS
jgi:hypothetical protein